MGILDYLGIRKKIEANSLDIATATMESVGIINDYSLSSGALYDKTTVYPEQCVKVDCCSTGLSNGKIAGMDIDQMIHYLPNVQFVVSQMKDYIFKDDLIVIDSKANINTKNTNNLNSLLGEFTNNGATNLEQWKSAIGQAILYGRCGVFNNSGKLEIYSHDRYSVVVSRSENKHGFAEKVLGYIVYRDMVPGGIEKIVDVTEHADLLPYTSTAQWIREILDSKQKSLTYMSNDKTMEYISESAQVFVNLRYDLINQNPESRLMYDRFKIENSTYLHRNLNNKYQERGLGRILFQLNNETTDLENDPALAQLINKNKTAKSDWGKKISEFAKSLANSIKRSDADDIIISPSIVKTTQRLENTNNPSQYLKQLEYDDTLVSNLLGWPAAMSGLGTLSDRNVSIASVIDSGEKSTVDSIRQLFFDQMKTILKIPKTMSIIAEETVDKELQAKIDKSNSDTVYNLSRSGFQTDAEKFVKSNFNL